MPTYEIKDGVRRAKAALLAGRTEITASVYDRNSGVVIETREIPIAHLFSPKAILDLTTSSTALIRFLLLQNAYFRGVMMPPIEVQVGKTGTPIAAVRVLQ